MKMLFLSSSSALGPILGTVSSGCTQGFSGSDGTKFPPSQAMQMLSAGPSSALASSGGGGGDLVWVRAAAGDRQDAAGG